MFWSPLVYQSLHSFQQKISAWLSRLVFITNFRLCLGVSNLQAKHGRRPLRRCRLLQQDRLSLRLLAHHDGLHLPGPLHLLHLLLQHRLGHPQAGILTSHFRLFSIFQTSKLTQTRVVKILVFAILSDSFSAFV